MTIMVFTQSAVDPTHHPLCVSPASRYDKRYLPTAALTRIGRGRVTHAIVLTRAVATVCQLTLESEFESACNLVGFAAQPHRGAGRADAGFCCRSNVNSLAGITA